jgi:hypothetical protein
MYRVPVLEVHIILLVLPSTFYLDESGSGSGLFSEVGSGSGPNRSGSATLFRENGAREDKFILSPIQAVPCPTRLLVL